MKLYTLEFAKNDMKCQFYIAAPDVLNAETQLNTYRQQYPYLDWRLLNEARKA